MVQFQELTVVLVDYFFLVSLHCKPHLHNMLPHLTFELASFLLEEPLYPN